MTSSPTPTERAVETRAYVLFFLVTTVVATTLDLVSKWWVFDAMGATIADGRVLGPDGKGEPYHTVAEAFFQIRLRLNRGAVWGMLSDHPEILLVLSIFAIGFIVYMLVRSREREAPLPVSLGLICGGALGNLWDRHFHAGVRDFLHVYWKDPIEMAWPTFNLADVFICIGVGLYLFLELFGSRESEGKPGTKGSKG